MRTFSRTSQFKKDVKRSEKRGKDWARTKQLDRSCWLHLLPQKLRCSLVTGLQSARASLSPRLAKESATPSLSSQQHRAGWAKLKAVLELLIDGGPLPELFKDHPLRGDFAGSRDCHIEPDWLLIYTLTENDSHVRFERTGTHSDLFR